MGLNGERLLWIMIADCAALSVKVMESSGGSSLLLEKLQMAGREACAKIRGVMVVDDDDDDDGDGSDDDDDENFVILCGERSVILDVERYT